MQYGGSGALTRAGNGAPSTQLGEDWLHPSLRYYCLLHWKRLSGSLKDLCVFLPRPGPWREGLGTTSTPLPVAGFVLPTAESPLFNETLPTLNRLC